MVEFLVVGYVLFVLHVPIIQFIDKKIITKFW